jgi:hypothetical protein
MLKANKEVRPSVRTRLAIWLYCRRREREAMAREFPWIRDLAPWWERVLEGWLK